MLLPLSLFPFSCMHLLVQSMDLFIKVRRVIFVIFFEQKVREQMKEELKQHKDRHKINVQNVERFPVTNLATRKSRRKTVEMGALRISIFFLSTV